VIRRALAWRTLRGDCWSFDSGRSPRQPTRLDNFRVLCDMLCLGFGQFTQALVEGFEFLAASPLAMSLAMSRPEGACQEHPFIRSCAFLHSPQRDAAADIFHNNGAALLQTRVRPQ
jgi:hypothetical protein